MQDLSPSPSDTSQPPSEPTVAVPPVTVPPVNEQPPAKQKKKQKLHFPLWLIIILVVGFWISTLSTIGIIVLGERERKAQEAIEERIGMAPVPGTEEATTLPDSGELQTTPNQSQSVAGLTYPYMNTTYGFKIEYPVGWRQEEIPNGAIMYEAQARTWELPRPYVYGRVIVRAEEQSSADVVAWFDERFKDEPDSAPLKRKLYTNQHNVPLLETVTTDVRFGRLRYYFVVNGTVISLSMNIPDDESINKKLQVTYGTIIDSVQLSAPGN